MKILVAGGAGFIGSHLCRKLLSEGHSVICMDNLLTGSEQNIADLTTFPRFSFIKQDITEPFAVDAPDQIYNLACPASPVHYQHDPVFTMKTSVFGAVRLLELARETHARILQASTSEIYGDPEMHPQKECYWGNVNPIGVRACYDEGKRAAETLFFDYHRQYGVPVKVVRIFNTYGPNMQIDDGRVISNFIVSALKGEAITVHGNGKQTRSFCYVDDLVRGLICMMNSPEDVTGPVNFGYPLEHTIAEIAAMICEMTGSSSELIFADLPKDDPKKRRPDISLAQELFGWSPTVPLEEGLRRTIAYFQSQIAAGI